MSIGCAVAFQSIETFFGFLAWFFGPKGSLDANNLGVSEMDRVYVDNGLTKGWPCLYVILPRKRRNLTQGIWIQAQTSLHTPPQCGSPSTRGNFNPT